MKPVNWGVISTAKIGRDKVIPAMQRGSLSNVQAICSRDIDKARELANALGIAKAYGSYEELLADPDIEAVYNPLPNHLHVPWTIKAAQAGKHVLCEKPIALEAAEVANLIEARDRHGVLIMEAFMVRTHPQWLRVRELIRENAIGKPRALQYFFSYDNRDPDNVRNQADIGGGGLLDIGCYAITASRYCFESEPQRVIALIDRDPRWRVDRLTSALLDFADAQASFTCSTQLVPFQRANVFGENGRIEVQIPCNAPPDAPTHIHVDDGSKLGGASARTETFDAVDQYTVQGDLFSEAIRGVRPQTLTLEDSVLNMRIIDALFRSAKSNEWEVP